MRPVTPFQHARAYAPLKARMAIVPVTMIASQMLPFVIIGGLFFSRHRSDYAWDLLLLGAGGFPIDYVTVEFDASRRAKIILREMGIVQPGEETVV